MQRYALEFLIITKRQINVNPAPYRQNTGCRLVPGEVLVAVEQIVVSKSYTHTHHGRIKIAVIRTKQEGDLGFSPFSPPLTWST